ncbi:MAG: M1 family aminopeptidase [Candidatus Zixiibacteriota bacterium]
MKPIRLPLILVVMLLTPIELSSAQEGQGAMTIYDQIKNVSLDDQKVAEVESLVLIRDAAAFRLNKGKICLFQPVEGRVTGAVFVGEGVFEFEPPTEIERYQLKKFAERENLAEEFSQLYLAFSDTIGEELKGTLGFSKGDVPGKFRSIKNDCPERLLDKTGRNIWFRILADILADSSFRGAYPERADRFFYAEIKTRELGRLFFTFDSKQVEEVTLEKPTGHLQRPKADLVCSFHQADDYLKNPAVLATPIPHEEKDEIQITHYKMDVEIDEQERLSGVVEMDYVGLVDGARVLEFWLATPLADSMEEITDEAGDPLEFGWEKRQVPTNLVLSRATGAGEEGKLVFKYSGNIIDRNWYGDFYIKSTTHWYPQYGYLNRATYDMTFRSPKRHKFVSIGRKVKEWTEGDYLCTQWEEDFPVALASFNFGSFDIYELEHEEIPPVSVYYLEDSRKEFTQDYNRFIGGRAGTQIMLLDSKSKKNVGADVVNSLNFYQATYGKCPFFKVAATEIPAAHGQGFPGLLHLSWATFMGEGGLPDTKFREVSFRAHEVSHQWWAHIVGWETYHDQWLSEGFAEYSGAWFAQMSTQDNEAFFDELEEWRKDIMGKGHKESVGSEAGPLWLGYRLNSSESSDYVTLVYEKGAYVLHMLRNMMMDYNAKSDSSFIAMMRDFVETYYGKEASTEDFKEIVEKHVGEDMDWFFDQWVYGVDIPTYKFSYSTKPTSDGKYIVTCEVDQENVSEDFKMWVPVLLDFGMDQHAILRLWVDKPHNEYQLPKAPLMPRKVTLNPAHAVLCEVKNK